MDTRDLTDALEDAGYEPRPYSGRDMYGKQCVGVVVSSPADLFMLGKAMAEYDIGRPTLDNMGREIIVYWPRCEIKQSA